MLYRLGWTTALLCRSWILVLSLPASWSAPSFFFFPITSLLTKSQYFPRSHTHSLSMMSLGKCSKRKSSLVMAWAPTVVGSSLSSLVRSQSQASTTRTQEVKRCSWSWTRPWHSCSGQKGSWRRFRRNIRSLVKTNLCTRVNRISLGSLSRIL